MTSEDDDGREIRGNRAARPVMGSGTSRPDAKSEEGQKKLISKAELAKICGVSKRTVSRWISKKLVPSVRIAVTLRIPAFQHASWTIWYVIPTWSRPVRSRARRQPRKNENMGVKQRGKKWVVRFSYKNIAGEMPEYFRGGFLTRESAEEHEAQVRQGIEAARKEVRENEQRLPAGTTFEAYAKRWVNSTLRARYRTTGFASEEGRFRNHLLPFLGDVPLFQLTKLDGEEFIAEMKEKEKGRSPKTINHCLMLAKWMLKDAVDEGVIERNPWERLKRVPERKPDWNWLRPDELSKFLAQVERRSPQWLLECLLSARAGLRTGEVAGLMVEDVNLETGTIDLKRDVVRSVFQPLKTGGSKRRVIAPSDLLAEMRRRARYALLRPAKVVEIEGEVHRGHPFSLNQKGEPHRYLSESIERPVTAACAAAGLRRITHYDLRHTYASHLRLKGVPLEDIRDLLGHESITMTLRYAHVSDERLHQAARTLEGKT